MHRWTMVLVFTTSVMTVAAAGERKHDPRAAVLTPAVFESLDRNADQRISRSEAGYDRSMSDLFVDFDADGDGFVTRNEFVTAVDAAGQARQAATR